MEFTTFWWLLTGALVALELVTGTFYLLMIAVGAIAGAIAAHMGYGFTAQLIVSSLVACSAVAAWHWFGPRKKVEALQSNQDVHLDVGSTVEVNTWSSSGATSVVHRGATWSARHSQSGISDSSTFKAGWHRIVAIDGNTLVLSQI